MFISGNSNSNADISDGLNEGYAETAESAILAIYSVMCGWVNNKNKKRASTEF